ncbi:MAG TPA: hypothetical protein VJ691_08105, partial [Vicinamibacterales bacterium]|nr:hypothetical protein [Vicinamibacterales bacterium]
MWLVLAASLLAGLDTQSRNIPLPAGKTLTIDATIANVRIEGWDKSDAEITIERHVPSTQQFDKLPVTIDDTQTRVSIRAVQADGQTDPAYRCEIVIRLPRSAVIERVQIVEGRIVINRFTGTLTADIRRGPIEGRDLAGTLRLETGIGSVELTGTRLSADGLLRLRAFNGDVRLTLAERPADARIMALALNGRIKSDIPLTMKDTWGPRWGQTTLGKGEPVISLD